ncbi:uncharacterized protein BP01DRAFT_107545 [Aspergillus saccharolyticus JOP 1030-1]|uniref:Uncharacterized protein n=1 Tax=Aspergillus saccharolyticus JOP 1030-1 TaxID=1450539 RepID=A0A318ZHV7_9EURO|nr:hypothetical protein BP01DRAFT_107545 [Aspergillus saccharolyticus JOP 1030-1]PYH43280.1 hypothetical protein BP01DRAFT_107545 [Aspergillus saccharolyticus JOP 1030-1]
MGWKERRTRRVRRREEREEKRMRGRRKGLKLNETHSPHQIISLHHHNLTPLWRGAMDRKSFQAPRPSDIAQSAAHLRWWVKSKINTQYAGQKKERKKKKNKRSKERKINMKIENRTKENLI